MTRQADGSRELEKKTREEQSFPCSNVSWGELRVTLTDSSATGVAAYLNVRKKDGIIKKGEKRACAGRPAGLPWAGKAGWSPRPDTAGRGSRRNKWTPDFSVWQTSAPEMSINRQPSDFAGCPDIERSQPLTSLPMKWSRLFSRL